MKVLKSFLFVVVLLFSIFSVSSSTVAAQTPVGWALFTNGGDVYKCEVQGSPQKLYDGNARHACWSADGRYVFFNDTSGDIWAMNNDGSNLRQLTDDTSTSPECAVAGYRPDTEYLLYVQGNKFYKINTWDGEKTLIYTASKNFDGEISINSAGTRLAARSGNDLYKITLTGTETVYAPRCSSSISPNGQYLTKNWDGHTEMSVYTWDQAYPDTPYMDLIAPPGMNWDNQKFSVNSDDHIVYKIESGTNGIGLVRVSDQQNFVIGNIGSERPDFFLGDLPEMTRIMPLGDSITKGSGTCSEPDTYLNCTGYRDYLWHLLNNNGYVVDFVGSQGTQFQYQYQHDNDHEGHGGWTPSGIDQNVSGWLNTYDPDIVLLHIGTNNTSEAAEVEDILDKIDAYESSNKPVTVILALIINRMNYHSGTTNFNNTIEAMALDRISAGDDIIIVDMENDAGIDYSLDMTDDKHPNASGYEKMADLWYSALTGVLNTGDYPPTINSSPITYVTIGGSYSYDVSASGSPAPNYSLTTAPSGMTINSATGLIEWTPSSTGSYNVTVTASNSEGSDTQNYTIVVGDQQAFTPGIAPIDSITATDNAGEILTVTFDGVTLDISQDDLITGTSTRYNSDGSVYSGGSYPTQDADNFSMLLMTSLDSCSYIETMFPEPVTTFFVFENNGNDDATVQGLDSSGDPVGTPIEILAGSSDYGDTGYTSGVGSQAVKGFAFTTDTPVYGIKITDGGPGFDPISISAVAGSGTGTAPAITSAAPTSVILGSIYTYDVDATGDPAPTFSLVTSPLGMTIDSATGLIEWTPSATGSYNVTVNAVNSAGSDTQSFTINVNGSSGYPAELIHYWKLDETTGQPYEDSSGSLHATCTSCPISSTGQVGNSLDFDGIDNTILTSSASNPTSEITVMSWINPDSLSDVDRGIVAKANAFILEVESNGSKISFSILENDVHYEFESSVVGNQVQTNAWTHVAVTFDGVSSALYINGTYIDGETSLPVSSINNSSEPYYIGWTSHTEWGSDRYFDGRIDEVAIFNTALDSTEIQQLYNNSLQGNSYYNLDQTVPVITTTAPNSVNLGQQYIYDVDANGVPEPEFSLLELPAGMGIDPNTGVIEWYPQNAGAFNVTVKAENTAGFDTQSFIINVLPNNLIQYYGIDTLPFGLKISSEDIFIDYDLIGENTVSVESWVLNGQPFANLLMPMQGGQDNAFLDFSDVNNLGIMAAYNDPNWEDGTNGSWGSVNLNYVKENYIDISGKMPAEPNASYTKSAWIHLTSDANSFARNNIISGNGHRFWCPVDMPIYTQPRILTAGHQSPWDAVTDSNQLELEKWYFVAVTYNGNTGEMCLYRDGNMVDSANDIPPLNFDPVTSQTFIGAYPASEGPEYFSDMKISRVALFDKPLKTEQIQYLYDQSKMIDSKFTDVNDIWKAHIIAFYSDVHGQILDTDEIMIVPGSDDDIDGILGEFDNCPLTYNPDQNDIDNDGVGDICDNCLTTPNTHQFNDDFDQYGNKCDNCPYHDNPSQTDSDFDGIGDICECYVCNLDDLNPVNLADFRILADNWLQTGDAASGDTNYDNIVDTKDLLQLAEHWLQECDY